MTNIEMPSLQRTYQSLKLCNSVFRVEFHPIDPFVGCNGLNIDIGSLFDKSLPFVIFG